MGDGVSITVDYTFKPGFADGFCELIPSLLPDTAKFDGFRSIRVVRHASNCDRVLLIEEWDSEADYGEYIAWRTERGDMERTAALLVEGKTEYWPTLVSKA